VKVRFQADANLDPDIGLGLQRRDPSIDYRLALGVIYPPGNWFAPPGSNQSSSGGNETAEASGAVGR